MSAEEREIRAKRNRSQTHESAKEENCGKRETLTMKGTFNKTNINIFDLIF